MADSNLPEIRPIEGFENYGVSADGRVWRVRPAINGPGANRPLPWALRQHAHKDGYLTVILFRGDGKRYRRMVADLVLTAFIGPRPSGLVVAHGDGNSQRNTLDNLRWATQAENIADKSLHGTLVCGERQHLAKLTEDDVRRIRSIGRLGRKMPRGTWSRLGAQLGVSAETIRNAWTGKTWRHIR